MPTPLDLASVAGALVTAGCVAADEEAEELVQAAHSKDQLEAMLARRLTGEPLAWITGKASFCGLEVAVEPGVYVPRWQSEPLAQRAAHLLPPTGTAVDLCTGSGAIALVMQSTRPDARVVSTEIDPLAAHCARANGLVVYQGDLDESLPGQLGGTVDVLVGVLPYVPTNALAYLPRDVQRFEPRSALDGGVGGTELIATVVRRSPRWVRTGGWLLVEIGGDQVPEVTTMLAASGYIDIETWQDEDGDPRGIGGRLTHPHPGGND